MRNKKPTRQYIEWETEGMAKARQQHQAFKKSLLVTVIILVVAAIYCGLMVKAEEYGWINIDSQPTQVAEVEEGDQSPDSNSVTPTPTQTQAPADTTVQTPQEVATTEAEAEAKADETSETFVGDNAGAGNENKVTDNSETDTEVATAEIASVATAPEVVTVPTPETVTATTPVATTTENSEGEEVENSTEGEEGTPSVEDEETPAEESAEKTLAELRAEALVQAKTIAEMPVSTGISAKLNILEAMISVCVGTPPAPNCGPLGFLWSDLKDFVPAQFMNGETKDEVIAGLIESESFVEVSADANSFFPGDLVFLEDGELALMSLGQFSTGDNLFVCYGMRQDCTVLFCTDSTDECLESLVAGEQSISDIVTALNGGEDTRIDRSVLETATVLRPKNNSCVGNSAEELLETLLPSAVQYAHNYLNK